MKFWQIYSISRINKNINFKNIAKLKKEWNKYGGYEENIAEILNKNDRKILDSNVDYDFTLEILGKIDQCLYLSSDNILRSYKLNSDDKNLNLVDCFKIFGGEIIEDTFEKGSTGPHNV